jgi:hypothetical protein
VIGRVAGLGRLALGLHLWAMVASCGRPKAAREEEAIRLFLAENEVAKDFQRIYPHSIGYFTLFGGPGGVSVWNQKVGLQGRYLLRMKMKVTMARSGVRAAEVTPPEFVLLELESITKDPGGAIRYRYRSDSQVDFDLIKWRILVQQGGDLSGLGITPDPGHPLDLFEENWKDF